MKIIHGKNKNLRRLILKYPYVAVHYCLPECPELIENYIELSTNEEYKDIIFISINAEKTELVKNIVEEFQRPLVAIYRKGLLIESKSVSSKKEMQEMLDKLVDS